MSGTHRGQAHASSVNERRVFWALLLTGGFMVVEVVGGILSGSLALLADAGHMLTDVVALTLAWLGFRIARRPADAHRSYGYHRLQILAAFVNGVILVGLVVWIFIEAASRLTQPVEIVGPLMLAVAGLGLIVNLVAFRMLHTADRDNLNIRGALAHIMGDLVGSAAAILAAIVILVTAWTPVDPLLSILVALVILRSAWQILRRSGHILLEGTPEWLDVSALRDELSAAVPAVAGVHHVHAWMLTSERPLITLHAQVRPGADYEEVLNGIARFLKTHYGISHATVQLEYGACPDDAPGAAGA